jgi:hypothetical protein
MNLLSSAVMCAFRAMTDRIPDSRRTAFRSDAGQCSAEMADTFA